MICGYFCYSPNIELYVCLYKDEKLVTPYVCYLDSELLHSGVFLLLYRTVFSSFPFLNQSQILSFDCIDFLINNGRYIQQQLNKSVTGS